MPIIRQLVMCVIFVLGFSSFVESSQMTVEPINSYAIYGRTLRASSINAVVEDLVSKSRVAYDKCVSSGEGDYLYFCSYSTVGSIGPHPTLNEQSINGVPQWSEGKVTQHTYKYDPTSGSSEYSSEIGSIAITSSWSCREIEGSVYRTSGSGHDKTAWCEVGAPQACSVGNPIDLLSGVKYEYDIDYRSPNGTLTVERKYESQFSGWMPSLLPRLVMVNAGQIADTAGLAPQSAEGCLVSAIQKLVRYKNPLKEPGVTETYEKTVCLRLENKSVDAVIYVWINGKQYRLKQDSSGVFNAEGGPGVGITIESVEAQELPDAKWRMKDKANVISYFDNEGILIRKYLPSGDYANFVSENNLLISQVDSSGRSLGYTYDEDNRLISITLPDDGQVQYLYAENENKESMRFHLISKVIWPDGQVKEYKYNELENILSGSSSDSYLTGKLDSYGNRIGNYKYSSKKAVLTEGFNGLGKTEVVTRYATSVKTKNGLDSQYLWLFEKETDDGYKLLTRMYQPAGAGSARGNIKNIYDSEGLLTQKQDYQGNKIQFAYDPIIKKPNVIVSGIAANQYSNYTTGGIALPEGVSKTSTVWDHSIVRKVKYATPGKITILVYHGRPDPFNDEQVASCVEAGFDNNTLKRVCRVVEQATTDANGESGFDAMLDSTVASRNFVFSYNNKGKLLTLSRAGETHAQLTHEYYASSADDYKIGDLKSTMNALGHKIEYLAYDAHGNVTLVRDANGVNTVLAYDTRSRITSVATLNRVTGFGYDLNGKLKEVTSPNGSKITREYDGAGQLVAIVDDLFNRMEFAYDLEGNMLSQRVLDTNEIVKFTYNNEYDALSRLEKTIQASGATTSYEYDKNGNLTKTTDAKNNTTSQTYTASDLVDKITDAENGIVDMEASASGRVVSLKDQEGKTTTYEHNGFGDVIKLTSPDTGITKFEYDNSGNLIRKVDGRDVLSEYIYDPLNRLSHIK